ncbi:MAG TPA: tRNA uridine-5-carboxymethylaminomethyl(34) synthesis GTPase MnmE [Methylococcus sp.]|nr:tRNA uridine-5-carboxymethylaminomethyl(34) synthesis GTPase MnmE [Methylococcus sp.]
MEESPDRDTIAAIATPPGKGGVGVVRISGAGVQRVIDGVIGTALTPRHAHFRNFLDADGSVLDSGLALYFPTPASFTGEDVLELHAHGSPVLLDLLLRRVLQLGCRLARPGEFSERAYLNGKIDLAQAEAVADLIDSATAAAARSAQRSLQGEFSRRIQELVEELIRLRLYVEAAIDFAEEEIDFLGDAAIAGKLSNLLAAVAAIRRQARQGALLREGLTVAIAGRPNAGKSSLLNALAGRETAIVTELPGTTRDLLREAIQIDGLPLHVIDTAGLRSSDDPVEREGIRRARDAIAAADCILLVLDARHPAQGTELLSDFPPHIPILRIHNKIDLTGEPSRVSVVDGSTAIHMSAKTGEGLELLRNQLSRLAGREAGLSGVFSARRRHLEAIERARLALTQAELHLARGSGELLAEELHSAQRALGEITGEFTNEDLLSRIFAQFCVGK